MITDATAAGPGGSGTRRDGTGGTSGPLLCDTPQPGRSPLRRLTRAELDNTLRDLLGDTTTPAARLVVEENGAGFSNNAEVRVVSNIVAEQYLTLAEDVARRAASDLTALMGCDPAGADGEACVRTFVRDFGKRAFRRPVATDEIDRMLAVFVAARDQWDVRTGVELMLEVMLQSPQFLYRLELPPAGLPDGEVVPLDGYQLATRLSYMLWATMPDDALFAAAEAGELDTPAGVAMHARRMLDDPRAEPVVLQFFDEWMTLEELEGLVKDASVYPDFDGDRHPELFREETHAFVKEVFATEGASFRTLLTADWSVMNAELATYYGVEGVSGDAFTRVALDPERSAGILTQASLLATRAKAFEGSPTHRGMFVRAALLCGEVPPPPPGVDPIAPDPSPDLTIRERLAIHREDPSCASCHNLMDPIGLGFEHFDGTGRWRDMDAGRAVDASGELFDTDVDGPFVGVDELATRLSTSAQVEECYVRQWFRYAQGRNDDANDGCSIEQAVTAFRGASLDMREMIVALTQTDAFLYRRVDTEAP